jgi:hypothetical protein
MKKIPVLLIKFAKILKSVEYFFAAVYTVCEVKDKNDLPKITYGK